MNQKRAETAKEARRCRHTVVHRFSRGKGWIKGFQFNAGREVLNRILSENDQERFEGICRSFFSSSWNAGRSRKG